MKTTIQVMMALVAAVLLVGCNIAGPAYPERNGRKYLESHGYPGALVDRVVGGKKLEHAQVLDLSRCRSLDVRHLVASNANLTHDEIDIFIQDRNDFVRSGAACNTSLSSKQIDILTYDSSHTVYSQLAGNTSLADTSLLRIHKERDPGLVWFASNPNCPRSIRHEIANSNDELAKQWLQICDRWKREGVYRQSNDGRWYKPMTYDQPQT